MVGSRRWPRFAAAAVALGALGALGLAALRRAGPPPGLALAALRSGLETGLSGLRTASPATNARRAHVAVLGKASALPDGAAATLNLAPHAGCHLCAAATVDVTWPKATRAARSYDYVDVAVRISYDGDDGTAALWTPASRARIDGDAATAAVDVCRLRLGARHSVEAWATFGNASAPRRLAALSHAPARLAGFADGPYATVTGDAATFGLVTTQTIASEGNSTNASFVGLVTVDGGGYVVWYHALPADETAYVVFDHAPADAGRPGANGDVLVMRQASGYSGNGWVNSMLYRVAATGATVAEYDNVCAHSDANFNMFTHECRAEVYERTDAATGAAFATTRALSLAYSVRSDFGNWSSLAALSKNLGQEWRDAEGADAAVVYVADKLVAWDDGARTLETIYDLFDVLDPVRDAYRSEAYAWTTTACRAADGKQRAVEWFHASSAARGADANYLVTSRNLDAVVSLAADGSGVQWVLAADPAAVGARYPRLAIAGGARARFYRPHAVSQPARDRLLLVDDGRFRANCSSTDETATCFSRAVEYALDFDAMTATLAWEFEFPGLVADVGLAAAEAEDVYNVAGGSVVAQPGGRYFAAFNSVDDNSDRGQPTLAFDVGPDGAYATKFELPRVDRGCGSYRAMPSDAVNGEATTSPFE